MSCRRNAAARGLCLCGWLTLACGCATHVDHLRKLRDEFYAGDLDRAAATIDGQLQRGGSDADVLRLERSMVELCSGRPQQAERTLREVRDQFDYFEQKSLGESVLAMAADDNRIAYAGEDYEKVLLRAFLAMANLMGDGGDAAAYGLQVTDKQNQIIQAGFDENGENPKLSYKRVALGAYIHGAMIEATHANYDDVTRSWAKVVSWEPEFGPGQADLQRAQAGAHSAPGHGVLYVFTLVGRGPYKREAAEVPSSAALLIADRILSHTAEHTLPPTIAPVKVPQVVLSDNRIRTVEVSVGGTPCGATQTITDVGQLAAQQYAAVYPRVLARAVVRRVVKKGAVYAVKEAVDTEKGSPLNFALDVAGVAWEASEAADTRCWGLLPDKIQVLRLELPAGEHTIGLRPAGVTGPLGGEHPATVRIDDGRNTYMLACFPDDKPVGTVLTSQCAAGW
ncbi:MAG TPA: hypothetical protein VMY42_15125 [Thermoguttaceae bacterium]|nr:hypothetical protein [Thermoguttaceae bacterium]